MRSPREEARLELVSLAAEVATVATRVRERTTRDRVNDPELEQQCRDLERFAAHWLSPSTDFDQVSDDEINGALKKLRIRQREAVNLMDPESDADVRNSVQALMRLIDGFISKVAG
jgi:hypothetical protein